MQSFPLDHQILCSHFLISGFDGQTNEDAMKINQFFYACVIIFIFCQLSSFSTFNSCGTQFLFPVIIVLIGKAFVDYLALRSGARIFLQRVPFFHFIIAELLHVPYIVIAAAIGQFSSITMERTYS